MVCFHLLENLLQNPKNVAETKKGSRIIFTSMQNLKNSFKQQYEVSNIANKHTFNLFNLIFFYLNLLTKLTFSFFYKNVKVFNNKRYFLRRKRKKRRFKFLVNNYVFFNKNWSLCVFNLLYLSRKYYKKKTTFQRKRWNIPYLKKKKEYSNMYLYNDFIRINRFLPGVRIRRYHFLNKLKKNFITNVFYIKKIKKIKINYNYTYNLPEYIFKYKLPKKPMDHKKKIIWYIIKSKKITLFDPIISYSNYKEKKYIVPKKLLTFTNILNKESLTNKYLYIVDSQNLV